LGIGYFRPSWRRGLNFKVPMAENVVKVDIKVRPHLFKEIDASSKEYQMVQMIGVMNFHIDPAFNFTQNY
jgi:hypothetical protein